MADLYVTQTEPEKAYLVGAEVRGTDPIIALENSLDELALLADTAGLNVVGVSTQYVHQIDPATFIGSGKVNEVRDNILMTGAQVVIFDDELSPRHQRELERRFGEEIRVIDRSALILDIFAQHANTHEGALQVELAQYEYRLPRLTRQWSHLARQAGGGGARGGAAGVGLRGPGETQLEVDRREISSKITKLRSDLERVRTHRETHRRRRRKSGLPVIALVGYTNAGKSTLLQALTGTDTYIADQLFATLDPLTRRTELLSGRNILLTDTVGFIQKLPTTLIAAFRATLEEITEASLLLHVVDMSHSDVLQHIETVEDTLAEIEMPDVPRVLVWNKSDLCAEGTRAPHSDTLSNYFGSAVVSARKRHGTDHLLQTIEECLTHSLYRMTLLIPYERGDIMSLLHDLTKVESQEHTSEGFRLVVQIPNRLYDRFAEYQVLE